MLATMALMLFLIGAGVVAAGTELIACYQSPYGLLKLLALASPWLFCRLLMAFIGANMQHHNSSPRIYRLQAKAYKSSGKHKNSRWYSGEASAVAVLHAPHGYTRNPDGEDYNNIGCWW
jgi:hypothetical protein